MWCCLNKAVLKPKPGEIKEQMASGAGGLRVQADTQSGGGIGGDNKEDKEEERKRREEKSGVVGISYVDVL